MKDALAHFRRFPRGTSLLAIAFCLASCAGACGASGAQQAGSGSGRLESVKVTGSAKFSSEQIAPATGLRAGQQVTREDLQKAANALAELGPFANVHYRFFSGLTGVQVEYEVTDAPTVPAFFDNFPWFTDAQMISFVKTSVPLFDGTAPKGGKILDDVSDALVRQMQAQAITGNVSHELLTLPWNGRQVMAFRVEGDGLPTIQSVEFGDPLASGDHAVRDRMGDLIGKPFSRTTFETFEFEQVRPVYLGHAFLGVKFGEPTARISGNRVVVQAPIDPGPAFTWNGATWDGNKAISSTDLNKLVNLADGESANGMQIQATWENVRVAYGKLGYLDVALNPVAHLDDATRHATFDVRINEGPQYRMGKLVLSGLSMEGEQRVRAAWKLSPGAVFDDAVYQSFLDSGIEQAFEGFPIHYQTIQKYLDKDPAKGEINVMLNFE